MKPYLLLTPGPLTTSETVKETMMTDWCTWDEDYNLHIVEALRKELVGIATRNTEEYTSVLLQGSGTYCVEAVIGAAIGKNDKLLICSNGAYGDRMGNIAEYYHIDYELLAFDETEQVSVDYVDDYLSNNSDVTHVAFVHCETTTGILNPLKELAHVVKMHGKKLIVDAMSSFGGIPMDVSELGIDFLISSANKCIQGVPGFGFIIARRSELVRCKGVARSLSLDIYDQWETMEKGYDDESLDNAFFVTGKCNSNCIMCPSPNVSRQKGKNSDVDKLIEIAKHIPSDTPHLTITGGEPFMIGRDIFRFIQYLHDKFTCTEFLFLTNGRIFAVDSFMKKFIETVPDNSIVAIPIHGSNAQINDMITQSKGSFAQTVKGIKQLLKANIRVELRIVVSKLNASDLHDLALFISQEFSEVEYVSIMAMEMTGSARVNQDKVWISYKEAGRLAQDAALVLIENGIDVRLYNFPLCSVSKEFWTLCKKSISPYKVRYSEVCDECEMKKSCGGVFAGTLSLEKGELKAIV